MRGAVGGVLVALVVGGSMAGSGPPATHGGRSPADPGTAMAAHAKIVQDDNVPYDGRLTFIRLRYEDGLRGSSFGGRGRGRRGYDPPWHHDYPHAERNLMQIMSELTVLRPYMGGSNILDLDDRELFKYPLAYMSEPGYWTQTEEEARMLREYLLKGGFLIFDDFGGWEIRNFEEQMRRVLPEGRLERLDGTEPVFNAFFEIDPGSLYMPSYRGDPVFLGIFEDNDRSKRLMVVVNYNTDIGDYWEYSATGWYPIDITNEAYKLGVNYLIYALTH